MNKTRNEWIGFIAGFNYKYFLTVTLNHKSRNSDKDIERFIRIIHQQLFGRNFIKNENLLGLAIVKEQQKLNNFKDHYHILVEEKDSITFSDLAKAIIHATQRCNSIQDLFDKDLVALTTNFYKVDCPKDNNVHLNIVEIDNTDDLFRMAGYICKTYGHNNFSNIYMAKANDNKNYFPIITGD